MTNQMPFSHSMFKIWTITIHFLMSHNFLFFFSYRGCFVIKEQVNCICIQLTHGSTSKPSECPLQTLTQIRLCSSEVAAFICLCQCGYLINICFLTWDSRHLWCWTGIFIYVQYLCLTKLTFKVIPCPWEVWNDIFWRSTKWHFPTPCSKSLQSQFIF